MIRGQMDIDEVLQEIRRDAGTCPSTGQLHELVWFRAAWWCRTCRQKIESCCEGRPQS